MSALGPLLLSLGRFLRSRWAAFSQLDDRVSWVTGFVCHPGLAAKWKYQQSTVPGSSVFKLMFNLLLTKNQQEAHCLLFDRAKAKKLSALKGFAPLPPAPGALPLDPIRGSAHIG